MNANELADYLDEYAGNNGYSHIDYADSMSEAATMLRQQQAKIEALKSRELTDKEIDETWNPKCPPYELTMAEIREFAKAILRKAQENG